MVSVEAPSMTRLKLTNWAAPAKTNEDIAKALAKDKPALTAIEPARIPHGITAMESGIIAMTPWKKGRVLKDDESGKDIEYSSKFWFEGE